jgi:hypothetical protein
MIYVRSLLSYIVAGPGMDHWLQPDVSVSATANHDVTPGNRLDLCAIITPSAASSSCTRAVSRLDARPRGQRNLIGAPTRGDNSRNIYNQRSDVCHRVRCA